MRSKSYFQIPNEQILTKNKRQKNINKNFRALIKSKHGGLQKVILKRMEVQKKLLRRMIGFNIPLI